MRTIAKLADRMLGLVVPQVTAKADCSGPYCSQQEEGRICRYATWQYRYRCCCSIPGGGYYCSAWSPWSAC